MTERTARLLLRRSTAADSGLVRKLYLLRSRLILSCMNKTRLKSVYSGSQDVLPTLDLVTSPLYRCRFYNRNIRRSSYVCGSYPWGIRAIRIESPDRLDCHSYLHSSRCCRAAVTSRTACADPKELSTRQNNRQTEGCPPGSSDQRFSSPSLFRLRFKKLVLSGDNIVAMALCLNVRYWDRISGGICRNGERILSWREWNKG